MAKNLSRREFLRLFTRSATQSAGEAVSVLVPPPAGMRRERRRARQQMPVSVNESAEPQMLCARCCVPFAAADDSPYCPDCRAQEVRSLSVLSSFATEQAQ